MLEDKIRRVENQMRESLAETRETFTHSGNKGTTVEDALSKVVREYLPRRLDITNGEIIDSCGNRSGQADLIIVNEDHPFTISSTRGPSLCFIEGVSAVGEIKSVLTSTELRNVLRNSVKYKKLRLTTGRDL
jgi:hypothetical protein